ncbi:putative nuclease HARBI1 [Thalassophryne amazonica]|uniref:putative nuclease HARBI1 n=1 Tax=Thalassophryne amazonica TaxID=390379 RepID=UPI0014724247|nr:putative nuclease HARBI1 [Thalassophryne amazonica]
MTEVRECVLSAGRTVLELLERDWQPLSAAELDLRLDLKAEELLEEELLSKLQTPAVYLHLVPSLTQAEVQAPNTRTALPRSPEEGTLEQLQTVDGAVVQYVTDLLQRTKCRTRMAGRAHLSLSHTVLLSLTLLSNCVSYRMVSSRFCLEKGNIHRIFFSFCERIGTLQDTLIWWPLGAEAVQILSPFSSLLENEKGQEEEQGAPRVLGVLGHTCIPTRTHLGKAGAGSFKTNAYPDSWLNVEIVCDRTGRLRHCRVSKGSDVDRAGALRDKLRDNPELMPPSSYLVARTGYPLTAQILTPYTDNLSQQEELFNKTLETHFYILDRAVSSLRTRFQRLRYLDVGSCERARAVVLAACVLHNICLDMGQSLQGDLNKERDMIQDLEGEQEDEGVRRRDVISDLLYKNLNSGRV